MKAKVIIFFSILFLFIGCGVMNNPEKEKEESRIGDGVFTSANSLKVSKINTKSLTITDKNRIFVDSMGDMSIDSLSSYRILKTSDSTQLFLTELNSTAQTLASGDLATVDSWIKNIKDANINYQEKNLLFYPISQNEDCGLKENVTINDNNAIITIQNSKDQCDMAFIYHVLLYKVDKSIENISVKAFNNGVISIQD